MQDVINAFGRFSSLFAMMNTAGNPLYAEMQAVHEGLDKIAMKLAEQHGIDYGTMVNENMHAGTEYPTADDLKVLLANGLPR